MTTATHSELGSKGDSWHEVEDRLDPVTLRPIRRYTCQGLFNSTPTYHTGISFTADSSHFVFVRGSEDGRSAVFKASLETGAITQLIDPVDGIGNWTSIQVKGRSRYADGRGISGGTLCLAPHSRWLAYNVGRSLRLVHIDSLEERTLIEDIGAEWMTGVISFDPLEQHLLFPVQPSHPDRAAGRETGRHYRDVYAHGGMLTRLISMPVNGGAMDIVHEEAGFGCAHCPHCPSNTELVLIDRDIPGRPINRLATRAWILHLPTGNMTPIRPRNRHGFQTHAAWTWDGRHVVYHGPAHSGGWFIGIAAQNGEVIQEWVFPQQHYGHVSPAPDRPAIILDGNLTSDCMLWLDYSDKQPRVEIIARHDSEWQGAPGQLSHPHAQSDRSGHWIAFNRCREGRTDVLTVRI